MLEEATIIHRSHRIEAALIGAYVADAASLGYHWLYDPERLSALARSNPVTFHTPDTADFDGAAGVFVHHGKVSGDLSHYGAQLRVMVQSLLARDGKLDIADYQARFEVAFGAGGWWSGYMDKATKGTLANLESGQTDPSGADDDQVPAVAKLPALLAVRPLSSEAVDDAVAVTNASRTAIEWSRPAARALQSAYEGATVAQSLDAAVSVASGQIAAVLRGAIDSDEVDSTVFAGTTGRACSLPQALPVIFHIAARAESYREAVTKNIFAAGDNCGRSLVLGALFAACHGIGGAGIPPAWLTRLSDGAVLTREIEQLVSTT